MNLLVEANQPQERTLQPLTSRRSLMHATDLIKRRIGSDNIDWLDRSSISCLGKSSPTRNTETDRVNTALLKFRMNNNRYPSLENGKNGETKSKNDQ